MYNMFSVDTKTRNGFDIIVLSDNSNGTSAEIIPSCGAVLHAFRVPCAGDHLDIIDSYADKKEFDELAEAKGFKGCKLSPFVCRPKNGEYEFGGKNYRIEKFFLNGHAMHGLIYDASFTVVKQEATDSHAMLELICKYNAEDKGYPFHYDCHVIYELTAGSRLSVSTVIKNHESSAIPVADGWHPYFTFGGSINDLEIKMNCNELLEFDAALLPTGKKIPSVLFDQFEKLGNRFLDNSFIVDSGAPPVFIIRDLSKKLQLEILPDSSYPVLQVYTPDHRHSIAVENLSGAPDAFNNHIGLITLQGGKEITFTTIYQVTNI